MTGKTCLCHQRTQTAPPLDLAASPHFPPRRSLRHSAFFGLDVFAEPPFRYFASTCSLSQSRYPWLQAVMGMARISGSS